MDRPNRNERVKSQDNYFNKYNDESYLKALEKYANELEKQLLIHSVVVPKVTLSNLDEAIKKAKPNMDKIKDVDKHIDSLR